MDVTDIARSRWPYLVSLPPMDVTDITKDGESLVLSFEGNAQGQSFQAVVTLEPAGETLSVWFDINQGAFSMSGTGTKAP